MPSYIFQALKINYNTIVTLVNFNLLNLKSIIGYKRFISTTRKVSANINKYKHRYHEESENALNKQIEAELGACYSYLSIATFFGRNEITLPGCYAFFFNMHVEELGHAHKLIRYQLMRGGKVSLKSLKAPDECTKWNIQQSFEKGLALEKEVKDCLEEVICIAEKNKDYGLADFIISDFIQVQDKSIQEYSRLLRQYESMTSGVCQCACADYLFDKELHSQMANDNNTDSIKLTDDEKIYK